jgi:hypothetical protein
VLQSVKGYAAPETGRTLGRARELWEQLGSPPEFLQVSYAESLYHEIRGELDLRIAWIKNCCASADNAEITPGSFWLTSCCDNSLFAARVQQKYWDHGRSTEVFRITCPTFRARSSCGPGGNPRYASSLPSTNNSKGFAAGSPTIVRSLNGCGAACSRWRRPKCRLTCRRATTASDRP